MKRLVMAIVVGLMIVFGLAQATHAASRQINSLDQQVTISQDGVADITETIEYDFTTTPRHGIERYYELSSREPGGKYYNLNFKLLSITQDGRIAKYSDTTKDSAYYIRVGDANATITGVHRYVIKYKVWPVVRQDPDGDYINYDVTGNDWSVPIAKASATITLPSGVSATATRCYTGAAGSTEQACEISSSGSTVTAATLAAFGPAEGFTINVLTPSESFTQYLTASDKPANPGAATAFWLYSIGIGLGLIIIAIGAFVRLMKWLAKRRSEQAETIVAQYEPPDGLLPAEMGVLEDLKLTMVEVTATIIDLAVKGYLKIRHIKGTNDYEFVILKQDFAGLQDYEQELMKMFNDAAAQRKSEKVLPVKNLDRARSSRIIAQVYNQIDAHLRGKHFYKKKISGSTKGAGAGVIILLAFIMPFIFGFWAFLWLAFPIISIIVAVAVANTPGHLTKKGYNQWAKVEGLKLFLTVAEKDRLKFHDAPDKNPELFSKLLSSAIALRVEKDWAKQFEGMDLGKLDWYDDYNAITPIYMASILNDSLSTSLANSFSPPASSGGVGSSSGGFSGGGFSGGGSFGGGGGGDW